MEVGAEEHLQPRSPQQHPRDRGCVQEVGAKGLGFRLCRSTEMPLGVDFSPQHHALVRVLVLFSFIQMFIVFSGLLPTHTNRSCDFLLHGFTSDENKRKGRGKKGRQWEPTPPIMSPCASAAHHTCGTLNRPLKYYDMEKITLCFNLSTKEQSNYRAKHSRGRPNKEKSKKIWWKFLRGLTMFNHASGLN